MPARRAKALIGTVVLANSLICVPIAQAQTDEPTTDPTATVTSTATTTEPTTDPTGTASESPAPSPSSTSTSTSTPTPSETGSTDPAPAPTASTSPDSPPRQQATPSVPPRNPASDELSEVGPEVQAAQVALALAQQRLAAAQGELAALHSAVDQARAVDEAARLAVEESRLAEQKVERELAETRERILQIHDTVGAVAREAYQGGSYLQLSVALEAASPKEFTDRLVSVQSVLEAEGNAFGRLAEARADLVNQEARLEAVRRQREQVRAQSAKALADRLAAERAAVDAQAELAAAVAQREAAVSQLDAARVVDRQRYESFSAVAGGLGANIRAWAAKLRQDGLTVNGTGSFMWPGTGVITSRFGPRLHPILDYVRMHTGLDIARGDGYVYAADNGVVVFTGRHGGYGNLTVIDHGRIAGQPVATGYGHQASMFVRPGQVVRKGQRIGVVGTTGLSTGPHIHFEVRIDGTPVDPYPWVAGARRP